MVGRLTQLECCNGWKKDSSEEVDKDKSVLIAWNLMMMVLGLSVYEQGLEERSTGNMS